MEFPILDSWIRNSKGPLDLTDARDLARTREAADDLLAGGPTLADLDGLESALARDRAATPLLVHLAVKLACSRTIVAALREPRHTSVVFAVYKETTRIRAKAEHEHGEDFLARKLEQLGWLFDPFPHLGWDLTVVDDGCPDGSGRLAADILRKRFPEAPARVIHLGDAIGRGDLVTRPMTSTADSQKGGSILYGFAEMTRERRPNHVVLFTDADLSTHLGQIGLLLDPIVNGDADAAIASRREPTSIVVKKGSRNVRGKLFIYLWKRMLPVLGEIVDTQCGFKAFRAEVAREIIAESLEKKFAFDIELLLKTELRRPGSVAKVPIAWIDSEAASTTTDIQPYLPMLQSVARMRRRYLPADATADAFAGFVEGLSEERFAALLERVPTAVAEREPIEFGSWAGVSVADLELAIEEGGPA